LVRKGAPLPRQLAKARLHRLDRVRNRHDITGAYRPRWSVWRMVRPSGTGAPG
jgi:hypothetical protein